MKKEKDNNENKKKKFRRFKRFVLAGTLAGIIILAFLQSKNRHTKHKESEPMGFSVEELDLKEHDEYDEEEIKKVFRIYYDDGTYKDFVCYKVDVPEPVREDVPDPTWDEYRKPKSSGTEFNSIYDDDYLPNPFEEDDFKPDPTWDDNITDPWLDNTGDEKPDNDIPSKKIGSMNH